MDFKVNDNVTIKDFTPLDEYDMKMKFGQPSKYQKFHGILQGNKIEGWICLDDEQIYGMTARVEDTMIELKSVGSGIDKHSLLIYAQFVNGTYDISSGGFGISELSDEFIDALNKEDLRIIIKLLKNKK